MKHTPVHNAGIPRANFHKTRTQIAHNGGLLFTQILKMCRVQEKDLVLRKARLKKQICPILTSWTQLQSSNLKFKDFITSIF